MPTIIDEEFGQITLRRSARASHVRIRVGPDGRLRASLPLYAPTFLVKRLLRVSRGELRAMLAKHDQPIFENGMRIGKSHTLITRTTSAKSVSVHLHGQQIITALPVGKELTDPEVSRLVRDRAIEALRLQAKAYLTKRLATIAAQHGFAYTKIRYSHASGRWGSCSSNGTISLNIALMKLPFELIDYVLIHELAHTVQMNHSHAFWRIVEAADPQYKAHRRALKKETPSI